MRYARFGEVPSLSEDEKSLAMEKISEVLELKNHTFELKQSVGIAEVPLIVEGKKGEKIYVEIHHPLTESGTNSDIKKYAEKNGRYCPIDSYTIMRDLPEAYKNIMGK